MTIQAYYQPGTVEEALGLMAEHGPSLLVMAGGTLAMPLINEGISFPERVLSLKHAGLNIIQEEGDFAVIGAMATMSQIATWGRILLLSEAAAHVGGWAVRNMGTAGGNLFAPPPAGDFAVALLALDARLKVLSASGERYLSLEEFYTGFMANSLTPGELVSEIQVPWPQGRMAYTKYGRRHANTPAIVTVAVHLLKQDGVVAEARIALNGVGDYPFRAKEAEASLVGNRLDGDAIDQAAEAAMTKCNPFTDATATAWYRRKMVGVYTRRTLTSLVGE